MVILNRYIKSELQGNYSHNVQLDLTDSALAQIVIDSKEESGNVLTCIMINILFSISLGMLVTIHRGEMVMKTTNVFIFFTGQAEWSLKTKTLKWHGNR